MTAHGPEALDGRENLLPDTRHGVPPAAPSRQPTRGQFPVAADDPPPINRITTA